jgi:hypothetical protein
MRKLLVSTLVSSLWVVPCLAQDAQTVAPVPPDQTSPFANPDRHQNEKEGANGVEDALRTMLAREGFTDIEMMPTSFLIHAKDADGKSVTLVFSPDGFAQSKQAPGDGQDDAAGPATVPGEQKF